MSAENDLESDWKDLRDISGVRAPLSTEVLGDANDTKLGLPKLVRDPPDFFYAVSGDRYSIDAMAIRRLRCIGGSRSPHPLGFALIGTDEVFLWQGAKFRMTVFDRTRPTKFRVRLQDVKLTLDEAFDEFEVWKLKCLNSTKDFIIQAEERIREWQGSLNTSLDTKRRTEAFDIRKEVRGKSKIR